MVDKRLGAADIGESENSHKTTFFSAGLWRVDKGENIVSQDINVLAMVKGQERYVFLFDDESRAATLRVLGRYASNPELSFSWHDAAVLSQRIRQEATTATSEKRFDLPLPLDQDDLL